MGELSRKAGLESSNLCTDDIERGQLELLDRVARELQAEAEVMSRMRHPK